MTMDRAGALETARATVDVLDRAVRSSSGRLPAEVVTRWDDFHRRWSWAMRAVDAAGAAGRMPYLEPLAEQVERWREALDGWGVQAGPVHVGLEFISPSRARARMDSVHAEVDTLDDHIRARRAHLGEAFVHAWTRYRDTWRRFYGGYPREWDWWYLGNASAWNETLVYQERLGDWRQAAERAGVRFTVPAPQRPPERRPSSWLAGARDIAIAGAIGAVAVGTVYLASKAL